MDANLASRLESLAGKRCIYMVPAGPEVWCTVLSIEPPIEFRPETLCDEIQAAINQSLFTVRYEGASIDGSDTGVISGATSPASRGAIELGRELREAIQSGVRSSLEGAARRSNRLKECSSAPSNLIPAGSTRFKIPCRLNNLVYSFVACVTAQI